jgi:hypothetical protein
LAEIIGVSREDPVGISIYYPFRIGIPTIKNGVSGKTLSLILRVYGLSPKRISEGNSDNQEVEFHRIVDFAEDKLGIIVLVLSQAALFSFNSMPGGCQKAIDSCPDELFLSVPDKGIIERG